MSYFNDYDYDDVYQDILYSDDPSNITIVSEFRHYINVHGCTTKILKHFNTTIENAQDVYEYAQGKLEIKYAIDNIKKLKIEHEQKEKAIEEARQKNEDLLNQYDDYEKTFCSIGFRKVKTRLTKLSKDNPIAKLFRLCLEAETTNIKAKQDGINYYPKYTFNHTIKDMLYYKKEQIIYEMIKICQENNIKYGLVKSDNYSANTIVFFELPSTRQISFHMNMKDEEFDKHPKYDKEWDGLVNSTLVKLEEGIKLEFPKIL